MSQRILADLLDVIGLPISLARNMHRFSSRSDESADLSALRHARGHPFRVGPRKRTVRYVEEAGGTRLRVGGTRLRVAWAVRNARRMISSLQ